MSERKKKSEKKGRKRCQKMKGKMPEKEGKVVRKGRKKCQKRKEKMS